MSPITREPIAAFCLPHMPLRSLALEISASPSDAKWHAVPRDTPNFLECPISQEVMEHPMRASDGNVYDRDMLAQWFAAGKATSPLFGTEMNEELREDKTLAAAPGVGVTVPYDASHRPSLCVHSLPLSNSSNKVNNSIVRQPSESAAALRTVLGTCLTGARSQSPTPCSRAHEQAIKDASSELMSLLFEKKADMTTELRGPLRRPEEDSHGSQQDY